MTKRDKGTDTRRQMKGDADFQINDLYIGLLTIFMILPQPSSSCPSKQSKTPLQVSSSE